MLSVVAHLCCCCCHGAGARGGRAEFSWENVKSDKDREFYLGHSVKASVGRWQKGMQMLQQHSGGASCVVLSMHVQTQQC